MLACWFYSCVYSLAVLLFCIVPAGIYLLKVNNRNTGRDRSNRFQTPDNTSGTIKSLPDILKIHRTSCIMTTFDMHKYSFCEINTYRVNKPCILLFFFFIPAFTKSLIKHAYTIEGPHKRRINLNTST